LFASAGDRGMQCVSHQNPWQIQRLHQPDLHELLGVIHSVRHEHGLGNRVADLLEPRDHALLDVYRHRRSAYFVARMQHRVVGGAGIFPLAEQDWNTCELQRMYLNSKSRGLGIGYALLNACIGAARSLGFERCYAETVSEMSAALAFYERNGFRRLGSPLGQSGHRHNDCWLLLDLGPAACDL
jgi:putative acetyltransferase